MGRSRHQLTVRVPIPTQLPMQAVLDALELHSPIIRHQALVTRFQRRPVELAAIVDDGFFASDGRRISQFDVYEKITFVPGVASKEISFPVVVQSTRDSVRCRVEAPAGIRLWSEYRIEKRRAAGSMDSGSGGSEDGSNSSSTKKSKKNNNNNNNNNKRRSRKEGSPLPPSLEDGTWPPRELASTNGYEGFANGDELYELVEDVLVEGNSMLMPFVARTMEAAHRELCHKVIQEAAETTMLQKGGSLGASQPAPAPRRRSN